MSAALRLAQLQKEKGGEPLSIAVLEKAREVGAHMLSGAVLDPVGASRSSIPDFEAKGAPLASEVHHDRVYFLTRTGKLRFPITPPPLQNHGNYIISLNRFVKWLGGLVEAAGHRHLHRVSRRSRSCTTAIASSVCAPAIAASASTASGSRRSSPASTSARR